MRFTPVALEIILLTLVLVACYPTSVYSQAVPRFEAATVVPLPKIVPKAAPISQFNTTIPKTGITSIVPTSVSTPQVSTSKIAATRPSSLSSEPAPAAIPTPVPVLPRLPASEKIEPAALGRFSVEADIRAASASAAGLNGAIVWIPKTLVGGQTTAVPSYYVQDFSRAGVVEAPLSGIIGLGTKTMAPGTLETGVSYTSSATSAYSPRLRMGALMVIIGTLRYALS